MPPQTSAVFLALVAAVAATDHVHGYDSGHPDLTKIPCSTPVSYQVAFMSAFTENNHPGDQNSLGPDFVSSVLPDRSATIPLQLDFLNSARLYTITPHIIVSHSSDFTLWAPGEYSSPGFGCFWQNGVFGGAPCAAIVPGETVIDLVLAGIEAGTVLEYSVSSHTGGEPCPGYAEGTPPTPCVFGPRVVTQLGNPANPASPTAPPFGEPTEYIWTIKVTEDFPYVSSGAMIGPSPDWGVGVSNLNLCIDGYWAHINEAVYPVDSGTKTGHTYLNYFNGVPESIPAYVYTAENAPTGDDGTKLFLDATQTVINPMGNFLFEPLTPCPETCRRRSRELLFAPVADDCPFYCGPQPYSWYSDEVIDDGTPLGTRRALSA